jgi:uncharacterized membrane protein YccC
MTPLNKQNVESISQSKRRKFNDGQFGTIILQFLVGSLVSLGGAAFAAFAFSSYGRTIGIVHLSIGILGLAVGIYAASSRSWPRQFLITVNVLTIAYSSLSEVLVEVQSLLPLDAALDSLIGTIIAIIMSGAVIYLVSSKSKTQDTATN